MSHDNDNYFEEFFMKRMVCSFLLSMQLLSISICASADLRARVIEEQTNFPQGDLLDVEYVQSILSYMYQIDQDVRVEFLQDLQINGIVGRDLEHDELARLVHDVGAFHLNIMKQILAVHGWITISKFGVDADHQAWLLIQHNDGDLFFKAGCLFVLTQLIENGQTDAQNYAYMYDRVCLNFGMKQKYGTQFMVTEDKEIVLYPYEGTLEDLNVRREKIGVVQSVAEYIELLGLVYT